jgi:hypothetical protein
MKMTIIIIGPKEAIANVSIVLVAEVHNGKNGRTVPWLVYWNFYRNIVYVFYKIERKCWQSAK